MFCGSSNEKRRVFSTKELEDCVENRKKGTDKEPVNWLKIRWIRVTKGKPFTVFFKHSLDEEEPFRQLDLKQYAPTKQKKNSKLRKGLHLRTLCEVQQSPLYPNRRPVTQAKKKKKKKMTCNLSSLIYLLSTTNISRTCPLKSQQEIEI